MKKSIAFLGALLFGSVTFGQVTKNDSIKKPASRKISADDVKKFPVDTETTATDGHIKIESVQKYFKPTPRKVSADDVKKFPVDSESTSTDGHIKIESTQKHLKYTPGEKDSYHTSAGQGSKIKGSVTQKGKDEIIITEKMGGGAKATTTERQHYTVKLTSPKPANLKTTEAISETVQDESDESGDKIKPTSNQSTKSSDIHLKIGDIKGEK